MDLTRRAADVVSDLLRRIGHPLRLSEVGVQKVDLAACADLAMKDSATMVNPRAPRFSREIVAVYEQAF